jgi:hypothetical protein
MVATTRRVALLAGALAVIVLFLLSNIRHVSSSGLSSLSNPLFSKPKQSHPGAGTISDATWTFRADRDRNDHSLTAQQCDAAFPELYKEIYRSQAYWQERQGTRKLNDSQWGTEWTTGAALRVMIYDGQLHVVESRGLNHFLHWEERSKATLANIHRALISSREPVPNIEFSIKIDDNIHLEEGTADTTTWCFSRNVSDSAMDQVWLIPDFNFWSYPRVAAAYGDYQREAIRVGEDYDKKTPELVWRGTQAFNPGIRQALLDISEHQPWSSVKVVKEDSDDEDSLRYRIKMVDHCRYKFAAHTEGTTWSGRLKYLLSCHSTIIIHPLTFTTHLYHLLKSSGPEQNYVETKLDWSDLPEKMEYLLAHDSSAKQIADNARDVFRDRYMTPAAQTCYWRRLFQVWSEMTPPPDPYVLYQDTDGHSEKGWRGMTYEAYM